MPLDSLPPDQKLPRYRALRHVLVFQLKLLADALRDLLMSPVSFTACVIDIITRPKVKDSLSYRLMILGRRSDRVINLFNEYSDSGDFTIDAPVKDVESYLQEKLKHHKKTK